MAILHFKATTTATPEQFVAALTDFGPGRSKIFENSTDGGLKVHSQGPTEVDYTVVRDGKTIKGKLLGVVVDTVGKGRLKKAFDRTVEAIEARDEGTSAAGAV